MTRLDKFVVALFVIVVLISAAVQRSPHYDPGAGRRPVPDAETPQPPIEAPAPERVRRPPLAAPGANDPLSLVDVGERVQHGTGTAFAAGPQGLWMTARHVVDGCQDIYVEYPSRAWQAKIVYSHPAADLALLASSRTGRSVQLADGPLHLGQDAYSFGYPTGNLGATHLQLLGRSRWQFTGRMSGITPTLTWAEVRRFPETLERLGGISGGPVFGEDGRLVGVHIGGSIRRGRSVSVAPEVIREVQREKPVLLASGQPLAEIRGAPKDLAAAAQAVSQGSRIVKVFCRAPDSS